MSGKYYPHNWDAISDAPAEYFESCTFEDFALWKINGWEIPSSVSCIIRAQHKDTGKVNEHVYKCSRSAVKRLMDYMDTGNYEVTICNHDSISIIVNNDTNDA